MRRITILLSIFLFAGCASIEMTEASKRVRFVTTTPHSCEYLGEVTGDFKEAKSAGIVSNPDIFAEAALKNNAAEMGADTVEIISRGRLAVGEAYRCGNPKIKPASSN